VTHLLKSRHFSVEIHICCFTLASHLYGFNLSHEVEVSCINICCFILVQNSDRLATKRHLSLFLRMDDLELWVSRSTHVKCKDGFELAAYGFLFAPHTYGHSTLTVWPQHAIYPCALCPKTDGLELWVLRSIEVKRKDGFELTALWFPVGFHPNYGAICYCFWDIQHFCLHEKPYSDPQFWGVLG